MVKEIEMQDAAEMGRELGWDIVLCYPIEDENKKDNEKEKAKVIFRNQQRRNILFRLRKIGFLIAQQKSVDDDTVLVKISAPTQVLEPYAELIGLEMKTKTIDPQTKNPYYEEFSRENRDHFASDSNRFFNSLERQKIIFGLMEERIELGGCGLDIDKLKREKVVTFVPLHDKKAKKELAEKWIETDFNWEGFLKFFRYQPLHDIRDYFGEKVAIYFAWLDWYTKFLMPLSIAGIIVFGIQIGYGLDYSNLATVVYSVIICLWTTVFVETWKRQNAALAYFWDVQDFEEEEHVRQEFIGTEKPGVFTDQGNWVDLSYKIEKEQVDKDRIPHSPYFPPFARYRRIAGSVSVLLVFCVCLIIGTFAILAFRVFLQAENRAGALGGGVLAGIVNGVFIAFMNTIYSGIAEKMNQWENHRTDTEYEDKLIAKQFSFKFVNSFSTLAFIAFAKDDPIPNWLESVPKDKWPAEFSQPSEILGLDIGRCKGDSCMSELFTQLMTLQLTMIFVSNFTEVIIPFLIQKIQLVLNVRQATKMMNQGRISTNVTDLLPTNEKNVPEIEKETYAPVFVGVIDEYTELMIQFGYVTLFACAFPLSSFCALINNFVEVRVDGFKLLFGTQRPIYKGAEDIGTWLIVLDFTSILSVISNCAIICFTSGVLRGEIVDRNSPGYYSCTSTCYKTLPNISSVSTDWQVISNTKFALDTFTGCLQNCTCESPIQTCYGLVTRIWAFVIAEHILIGIKVLMKIAIPDKPGYVAQAEARAEVEKSIKTWEKKESKVTPEELQEWITGEYSSDVWDKEK
eukprot:c20815_g1_i3.p1 GENE.c20815_g1_i3~~c20815_g1_i3.p1  ORF type:complete len:811 (+),score=251.73 c20815_g1_i3:45-2435(+)